MEEHERSPRLRRAVRALVVRADDAVLLVHFHFASGAQVWALPGGGIERGETDEEAIRRELAEEVGVHRFQLGPVVWTRTHVFELSPEFDGQHERVFLVRIDEPPGEPGLTVDELRSESVTGSRWWTEGELRHRPSCSLPVGYPSWLSRCAPEGRRFRRSMPENRALESAPMSTSAR